MVPSLELLGPSHEHTGGTDDGANREGERGGLEGVILFRPLASATPARVQPPPQQGVPFFIVRDTFGAEAPRRRS